MKKIMLKLFIFAVLVFSFEKSSAKVCYGYFDIGGTNHIATFVQLSISVDTLFDIGTAINLPVIITIVPLGGCNCTTDSVWWMHNGNYITDSLAYTVIDTGIYNIYTNVSGDLGCEDSTYDFMLTLHVGYRTATSVSEIYNPNIFQIYPAVSTGIFKIKTDAKYHFKKIAIADGAGRTIYSSSTDFSEVNLGHSEQGIYFYTAEDETGNIYRGKLIRD